MMKFIRYISCLIALLLAYSCAQDEGNYVYKELEEPVISGLADTEVLSFERLRIVPVIEGVDPDGFTFEWKAVFSCFSQVRKDM